MAFRTSDASFSFFCILFSSFLFCVEAVGSSGVQNAQCTDPGSTARSSCDESENGGSDVAALLQLGSRTVLKRNGRDRKSSKVTGASRSAKPSSASVESDGEDAPPSIIAKSEGLNPSPSSPISPPTFFQVDMLDGGEAGTSWFSGLTSSQHSVVLVALVFVLALVMGTGAMAQAAWLPCRRLRRVTSVRQRTEMLRLTHGSEISDTFAVKKGDESSSPPLSPGMLVRIQGRVVARPENTVTAPFSGQTCVAYSASVAHRRLDGVHQPPVAFHSACTDFDIELLDAPEVRLTVHGHDVALFDMVGGLCAREHTFATAPDSWRAFALARLVTGSTGSALGAACNVPGLGPSLGMATGGTAGAAGAGGLLQFRESALLVGATVTCVGEVARDRFGDIGLLPWRPPTIPVGGPAGRVLLGESFEKNTWESLDVDQLDELPRDTLAGQVMISDDPALLCGVPWKPFAFA